MEYKFEDIATNVTAKGVPSKDDIKNYIGLEHLVSGEMFIKEYGSTVEIIGEKLIMKKGDILFGKRNTYLRRVAIAPCDGYFSAHGMILRPRKEVIDEAFFPWFIFSDYFMDEAIRISVGSLSPTLNWKDIKVRKFNLPPLSEQKRLAEKLWAAYEVKQSYINMIAATDEMVKSQFIEMFGASNKVSINNFVNTIWGSSPDSKTYNENGDGVPFYQGKTEFGDLYINEPVVYCSSPIKMAKKNSILMSVRAPVGAVNIATQDCCIGRGLASITPIEGKATTMFVFYALKYMEDELDRLGTGSTFKAINKDGYAKVKLPEASITDQEQFVCIAEQADKSKAELRKSIASIDKVIKSLINENL